MSLRVDEVRALLPDLAELRPLLSEVLATSTPDPERRWSAAGELETVGARLVRPGSLAELVPGLAERARAETAELYGTVAAALAALERSDHAEAGRLFLEAAARDERAWRLERAEAWCEAAWRTVSALRDRRPAARALRRWARASRARGGLVEASARYEEAHRVAADTGDPRGAAEAAIGRGNVAVDQGAWSEAGVWYRRALDQLDEEDGAPERWHAYQNLSIVARRSGELDACRDWLERAADAARELADPAAAVEVENGWGMWALASGRAGEAESRFRAALDAAGDPLARVTVGVNLGHALLAQGRSLEAAEVAREAEVEALAAGVMVKLPEVYRLLGQVAAERGHGDAFVFFERALEVVTAWGLPAWERAETLEAYAAMLEAAGDPEGAGELRREVGALRGQDPGTDDEGRGAPPEGEVG